MSAMLFAGPLTRNRSVDDGEVLISFSNGVEQRVTSQHRTPVDGLDTCFSPTPSPKRQDVAVMRTPRGQTAAGRHDASPGTQIASASEEYDLAGHHQLKSTHQEKKSRKNPKEKPKKFLPDLGIEPQASPLKGKCLNH